jgi:hypothetical protein
MSNAKYRPNEAAPAPSQPAMQKRLTPIQAMAKCIRDHRLFALYIELGGAAIDARIEYFMRVMRKARPCMEREITSEQEEWAKHEKNPDYRPRRVRPTITTREAIRAVNGVGKATDERNALMLEAMEAAANGMVAQDVFLKRALKAFENVRKGITTTPLGCDESDIDIVAAREEALVSGSGQEARITGEGARAAEKEAAATPTQSAAA